MEVELGLLGLDGEDDDEDDGEDEEEEQGEEEEEAAAAAFEGGLGGGRRGVRWVVMRVRRRGVGLVGKSGCISGSVGGWRLVLLVVVSAVGGAGWSGGHFVSI